MDFLFSVLAFAVVLIPAIIIHELGHFIAAKMVGINVLEFGVGFPPRAMRLFMWGETEFTLNWLPIGGFVRPLGEDMIGPQVDEYEAVDGIYDEEEKAKHVSYRTEREELMLRGVPEHKLMSVNEAKPLPRIWFMAAGATFNVVSAIIFFIITALFGIPIEQGASVLLSNIPDNSIFVGTEVRTGDAIQMINGEYIEIRSDFLNQWLNADAPLVLSMRHPYNHPNSEMAGQRYTITVQPQSSQIVMGAVFVTTVLADSPAEAAGLLADDRIIAIDGQGFGLSNPTADLVSIVEEKAGQEVSLSVLRDGTEINIRLTPLANPEPGRGRIGISITPELYTDDGFGLIDGSAVYEYIPQDLGASFSYGFEQTFGILQAIWNLPGQIIRGEISPEQARPVSVVGVSQIGGQFIQRNMQDGAPWMVLQFIGMISIFLGITNLLPIPPLDGGRILFVLIEIATGKPVPVQVENAVNRVGLFIMLGLGLIVILLDIINPFQIP